MEYTYHSQHQAESFAESIIPVPGDYPLKPGLPETFRDHFKNLCGIMKSIYADMAMRPEGYGVMLLTVNETDHNRARDSYRTIHRLGDILYALFTSGEVKNNCMTTNAAKFNAAVKKISKYGLLLNRLCDFGFTVSNFNGETIDKKAESFTVEYPDSSEIIGALKFYCDEWFDYFKIHKGNINARKDKNNPIKLSAENYRHHFYRFDYKMTADMAQIPMITWVNEEADFQGYGIKLKEFNEAFFKESLNYKDIRFDGDYNLKSKRIARITQTAYGALGTRTFKLSIKLPSPDKSMDAIMQMPESVKELFKKDWCGHCQKECAFRLRWKYDGNQREGCAYHCFNFGDFDKKLVPGYWRMLELQYGLKKGADDA